MMKSNYRESSELEVKCGKKTVESRYHSSEQYYVRDERLTFPRKASSEKRPVSRIYHRAGFCSGRMDSFSSLSTVTVFPEKAETASNETKKKCKVVE